MLVYPNYYIFFLLFPLLYIRMNGKSINFDNNNIKKATFTKKKKQKNI